MKTSTNKKKKSVAKANPSEKAAIHKFYNDIEKGDIKLFSFKKLLDKENKQKKYSKLTEDNDNITFYAVSSANVGEQEYSVKFTSDFKKQTKLICLHQA